MGIFDIFSKRFRKEQAVSHTEFSLNHFPSALKIQIIHIIRDTLGTSPCIVTSSLPIDIYKSINDTLCREYGVFQLNNKNSITLEETVLNFFLQESSTERSLDFVEICFQIIDNQVREFYVPRTDLKLTPDEAIRELNARFLEHNVGFQFESSKIIRHDSEYLHMEAVRPTLLILKDKIYCGANEEFLIAHEHYRHGRHKESLVEALKSFESVLKIICQKRSWAVKKTDTARALINTCQINGLIPNYLQEQMTALRMLLESGVPTIRNNLAGHGQGENPVVVPDYMVRYALNLTASSIVFITEADAAL